MPDPSKPPGAGEGAESILDPNDGRDRATIRRALLSRWPITPEKRQQLMERLAHIAATSPDPRAAVGASRVLIAADALNQADEHLADKNARMDAGKPTDTPLTTLRVIVPGMKNEE